MNTRPVFLIRRFAARILLPFALWGALLGVPAVLPTAASADDAAAEYPFALTPRAALERLSRANPAESPTIHEEEWKVLDAAWRLRSGEVRKEPTPEMVVDAMFVASNVQTEAERAVYRDKVRRLTAEAREAVKAGNPSTHPGESLLEFLHAGVMKGGYEENQSSLAALFDTGKYNCVSSTAIYYVVGRELGLKLQIVSIPGTSYSVGHACLDLLEGDQKLEIEPTNPDGFDWGTKLKQPGVSTVGPQPDRKYGHVVDGLGLAAAIYSNRGVRAAKKGESETNFPATLSLGLRALFFDPVDNSAAHNVTAGFTNWGPVLWKAGRFEEAFAALSFGFEVTKSRDVKNNLAIAADHWFGDRLQAGGDREAQQIIERVLSMLPDETDFKRGEPWTRYARNRYDEHGLEAALAVVDRALAATPDADHNYIREYRVRLFLNASEDLLDKSDFDGSLKVLARAMQLDPQSRDLKEGVAWHLRVSLRGLDKEGAAPAAAISHFQRVTGKFPQLETLAEEGLGHAHEVIESLCDGEKYEAALVAAAAYSPLAKSSDEARSVSARVWQLWARRFAEKKDWNASLEKLRDGLKACPGDEHLTNGALATIDSWAEVSIDVGDWNAAIGVYDRGLACFPDNAHLKNNREYCLAKRDEAAKK